MAVVITSAITNITVIEHTVLVTNQVVVWSTRTGTILWMAELVATVVVNEAKVPNASLSI